MTTPDPYALAILIAAAFRLARLVGWDDLTITLRGRLTGVEDRHYQSMVHAVEQEMAAGRDPFANPDTRLGQLGRQRYYIAKLIRCAWCGGFWISAVLWLAWQLWPVGIIVACTPFAISAGVGLIAKNLDK